jgi:DNA-binding MarR family transcriptional regulator
MADESGTFQETVRKTLGQVLHISMHHFWRFAKEKGLSMAQVITLRIVSHQDEGRSCSVSDISELLGVTNAAVSQSLDKLVELNLVERQENPQDRRSKQILLTSQGEDLLMESMRAQQAWIEDLPSHLTPEEQDRVESAFHLLSGKITGMDRSP